MKLTGASIFALRIPFVEAFSHSSSARLHSDAIVVRITADDGSVGYGEGLPRPYVTGETRETCIRHMVSHLWPAVSRVDFADLVPGSDPIQTLEPVEASLPVVEPDGVIAWNAARAAFEMAIVDVLTRRQGLSLAEILPPKRPFVVYSGVIGTGPIDTSVRLAAMCVELGVPAIKIKIAGDDAIERVAAVREVVGSSVSLRVDANGAYTVDRAIDILNQLAALSVECAEQPIPRGAPERLAAVRAGSPIPVMADESLVTVDDSRALVAARACEYFNLRLSKCGGIRRTLEIADVAQRAGVRLQVGCQVGEVAILSAAGRHLAAYLDDVAFVEGSYGSMLLSEDIGEESIGFGSGGIGKVLRGPGLGVRVVDDRLLSCAESVTRLGAG
jgi:muconate cycloisomerase